MYNNGWSLKNVENIKTKEIIITKKLIKFLQDGLSSGHASDLDEEAEVEQHVPSVLTSQQQHHQQQKQQQQQHQQQQQITSQSRRSGPDQNVGRSVGSNGQISNPGPASGNSGNHGHDNGQTNVMASHGLGGPGAVQSSHVGSSQGYSNVNQGHANVLSSLLALSDPQVGSCSVDVLILTIAGARPHSPASSISSTRGAACSTQPAFALAGCSIRCHIRTVMATAWT